MCQINTELSPEAQKLYERDMEIIDFEVAKENINEVQGQYIHECYLEEDKGISNKSYYKLLKDEITNLQNVLDFIHKIKPEQIAEMSSKYGEIYKKNKSFKLNGKKLL
jgi:hypothetical protein